MHDGSSFSADDQIPITKNYRLISRPLSRSDLRRTLETSFFKLYRLAYGSSDFGTSSAFENEGEDLLLRREPGLADSGVTLESSTR
jgi:hypothetical protein